VKDIPNDTKEIADIETTQQREREKERKKKEREREKKKE